MGELVKIVDSQNPKFGKVYQVVELIIPSKYKLAGEKSLISQVWSQDSLESVDLLEILNKVNHQNNDSSGQMQDKIQELIFEKQILLEKLEKTLAEKLELESLNSELKKRPFYQ
jgi:hypothetical protein